MTSIEDRASTPAMASACLLLFSVVPGMASAYPAAWESAGTVTTVETAHGTTWPSNVTVGAPVRVVVSFDTNERFSSSGTGGCLYQSSGTPSLQIAIDVGTKCTPCVPTLDSAATPNSLVVVRDNYYQVIASEGVWRSD